MPISPWDDSFSIGIAEIDVQHKQMIATMHDLHHATMAGQAASRLGPALAELDHGFGEHFRAEEVLMSFHKFPELDEHRLEHRLISAELSRFLAAEKNQKPGVIVNFLKYLEDWQDIHVLQHDMKYRDFLMHQWGISLKQEVAAQERDESHRAEGRRHARYACSVPVQLSLTGDSALVYAQCVNISETGAFLKSWLCLCVNSTATARFQLGQQSADVRVCIRRSEPCVGAGVSFIGTLPAELRRFLTQLARNRSKDEGAEATCDRILHDCVQNLAALEDVISETEMTPSLGQSIAGLLTRAQRLHSIAV